MARRTVSEKKWWQLLDWSQMETSFHMATKTLQSKILEEGYWSLGKGVFEENG